MVMKKVNASIKNPNFMGFPAYLSKRSLVFLSPNPFLEMDSSLKMKIWNERWRLKASSKWNHPKSPYAFLELEKDADEEQIKVAHRRLAKTYHPDVYKGNATLDKGETAEARFINIQAAYELLIDEDRRRQYDLDSLARPSIFTVVNYGFTEDDQKYNARTANVREEEEEEERILKRKKKKRKRRKRFYADGWMCKPCCPAFG
ncbi:OLC1v1003947C1 [Oldenlandia corymbosa var. corymbosa]|nr:OLC1v1003947C1 [Oldenlandia corymbosa var. corymbosa]